jgi:hypothetical protein
MLAHGFTTNMVAGLVRKGVAMSRRETMMAGGRTIKVAPVRITDAGRDALA